MWKFYIYFILNEWIYLGGGPSRQRRGEDIVKPFNVTLEDLYNGKTAKISLQRDVVCPSCHGYIKKCPANLMVFNST